MPRWGDLDDRQFPAPRAWWDHCALHTRLGIYTTRGCQYRQCKANKDILCALLFFRDVFFNFLRGRRRLPYLRLFIPANRLVAFCLQVTHPEVTFNSWTKKCVVMLYGTASQPEEITNTVNSTKLHSWPIVRGSRHTERHRKREIQHSLYVILLRCFKNRHIRKACVHRKQTKALLQNSSKFSLLIIILSPLSALYYS